MIKKENDEYYFILDNPINLTLEIYIDHKKKNLITFIKLKC